MIDTTKPCSLIPIWMTLTFIQGHSYMMIKQKLLCCFPHKSPNGCGWNFYAAMTWWSVKFKPVVSHMIHIQGRELNFGDFKDNIFKIALCLDASELICFKLGMMIDMTKLPILIPVWSTLTLTQGHRVVRKLELTQSFCSKVAWRSPDIHSGWVCRGMSAQKSCKYVWWIWSFERLFILL